MYQNYNSMLQSYDITPKTKVPIREYYNSMPINYYSNTSYDTNNFPIEPIVRNNEIKEPSLNSWFSIYMKSCYILAATYTTLNHLNINASKCYYEALSEIIPNQQMKILMQNFIIMTTDIRQTLLENKFIKSFFIVHPHILDSLNDNFFNNSFKNSETLFIWVYLLDCYLSILTGQQIKSFNNVKNSYDKNLISKEFWANPIWYILHFSAYHAPIILNKQWSLGYKAFVCCLMITLPCSICRNHLKETLPKVPIDNYLFTRESIFEWSVDLHNLVNKDIHKPIINIQEALKMYGMNDQPYIKQNSTSYMV
jgi:hypothetical protein